MYPELADLYKIFTEIKRARNIFETMQIYHHPTFKSLLLFCCLLCLGAAQAQSYSNIEAQKKDIFAKISTSTGDIQKAVLFNQLGDLLIESQPDSAFIYAKKAQKITLNHQYNEEVAKSYNIIGAVFFAQSLYNESLKQHIKALELFQNINNQQGIAKTNNYLGTVYLKLKKQETAKKYYYEALRIYEQDGGLIGKAKVLGNIGFIYEKKAKYDSALYYQQEALKIYEKLNYKEGLADIYDNIGSIYEDNNNFEKAYFYFTQSLVINEELKRLNPLIRNYNDVGDCFRKQKKYEQALIYTNKAMELAKQLNNQYEISSTHKDLAQVYAGMGDFRKAYDHHVSYHKSYARLFDSESSRQASQMQVVYEIHEKDQEIQLLESNRLLNRFLLYGTALVLLLFLILAALIYNRQKLLIVKNKKIYAAQEKLALAELENMQLKEQKLQTALTLKEQELTGRALLIIQKNEILNELKEKLHIALKEKTKDDKDTEIKRLIQLIEKSNQVDKDWEEFANTFQQIHPDFFQRLQNKYPELTAGELRLCSLLKLNMNSKEIAITLGISPDSLRVSRHRLRKKLNIEQGESLTQFVMTF